MPHESSLPSREGINGVDVWRVWTSRRGRQRLRGRSLDYASFYFAAGWRLWRMTSPGNIVIAKTDPPLLSVIAACIARPRGARLINWQQDIFPEVADALGMGGRIGHAAFALLRRPAIGLCAQRPSMLCLATAWPRQCESSE